MRRFDHRKWTLGFSITHSLVGSCVANPELPGSHTSIATVPWSEGPHGGAIPRELMGHSRHGHVGGPDLGQDGLSLSFQASLHPKYLRTDRA